MGIHLRVVSICVASIHTNLLNASYRHAGVYLLCCGYSNKHWYLQGQRISMIQMAAARDRLSGISTGSGPFDDKIYSTLREVMQLIKQLKEYSTLVSNFNADLNEQDQLPAH